MTDVPPGRQCTPPNCSNEVVDERGRGGLCPEHLPESDGSAEDAKVGCDASGTVCSPEGARHVFGERLEGAELDAMRFIDVHDGEKRSTNHTQRGPTDTALSGNYIVYGGAGDGERAPDWIPETFTVASPHTDGDSGGHFHVAVPADAEDALEDAVGTANPGPS